MKEIAVIGGTFDPVTLAHEAIVQACLDLPDIDEVWVLPSGMRRDKPEMLSNAARLYMLELVKADRFESDDRLVVTDFEQRLPQPTQTYQTVAALNEQYPDTNFWFVFGADSYEAMPTWRHGRELQRTLGMLVVARTGYAMPDEASNVRHLRIPGRIKNISSTQVRQGGGDLVSPVVARHISEQRYYATVSGI